MAKILTDGALQPFDIPLSGRYRNDIDPLLLAPGDFQALTNLRYGSSGPCGIAGMTKINAAATAYTSIINGYHFRKDQPSETHIFAQTTSGASSRLVKSDNTATIPAQDTFTAYQTLANNNTVYFSKAPDNCMAAFNGSTNYIWGGTETRCGQFILHDDDYSYWLDYTGVINNTLTDAQNVATFTAASAGFDPTIKTLLSLDNNTTDDRSSGGHTWTNVDAHVSFDSNTKKFGTHSAKFNGTSAYLTAPDNADFDFSLGTFTIDCWVNIDDLSASRPIYYQQTTSEDDSIKLYVDTTGRVRLSIKVGGVSYLGVSTGAGVIETGAWHHIAVVESGNSFYLFVDGVAEYSGTSTRRAVNYTGLAQIGYDGTTYFDGFIDEFRICDSAKWTSAFTPPTAAYASSTYVYALIGATRPIQGASFYMGTVNAQTSVATAYEWNGAAWSAVKSLVDGTSSEGVTLAQDGKISFTSTVSTAKAKIVRENMAYYYLFYFSDMTSGATIERCTLDIPMQALVDLWGGIGGSPYAFYRYTAAYADLLLNISGANPYVPDDDYSYAQLGTLTSSQYVYVGFDRRAMGIKITMPDDQKNNTTASTTALVDYWNGSAWTTVGSVTDSTNSGGISLSHSGTISWNPPDENSEFMTTRASSVMLFYYRVHFDETLSSEARISSVTSIPAQTTIRPFRFPLFWQNRLWLCNDQTQYRNMLWPSATNTAQVFNGSDTMYLYIGGDEEVVAGSTLFTRYGGSLYDNAVVFKRNETHLIDGVSPSTWRVYQISDEVGCIAPLTLQKCDTNYEVAPGITKHILVWMSSRGIEAFDGNTITTISGDISDFFDATSSNYINTSISDSFLAFYDSRNAEYHVMFASGASTSLNEEWVYDLKARKWYEVDRGASKRLNCGFTVNDARGIQYIYGGTTDGYLERLEYGTTFDGNSIVHTLHTGDVGLVKSLQYITKIRHLKVIAKAKTTSAATVAFTHYADSSSTGTTITASSQQLSGKRIYTVKRSGAWDGILHSLKMIVTTTDESCGFEPIYIGGLFSVIREDI